MHQTLQVFDICSEIVKIRLKLPVGKEIRCYEYLSYQYKQQQNELLAPEPAVVGTAIIALEPLMFRLI